MRTFSMILCFTGGVVTLAALQGIGSLSYGKQEGLNHAVLTAQRLDLVDHKGRTRISLDADREGAGPSIRLLDDYGKWQLDLGATQGGRPSLALVDAGERLRLMIGFDDRGNPSIEFKGPGGEGELMEFAVSAAPGDKTRGVIRIWDSTGKLLLEQ